MSNYFRMSPCIISFVTVHSNFITLQSNRFYIVNKHI